MKYIEYNSHDFIKEESFVKWVLEKDPHLADFWEKWRREHPEKEPEIEDARQIVLGSQYNDEPASLTDQEYLELYEDILKEQPVERQHYNSRNQVPFYRLVAAAVILLVIGTVAYYGYLSGGMEDQATGHKNLSYFEKATNRGEKLTFRLPDGSTVKLNAASRVQYDSDFGSTVREVTLVGEAFFEVEEDPSHPFIVKTGRIAVTALGTSFNVNSYHSQQSHSATLVTGKVAVKHISDGDRKILRPGEQAIADEKAQGLAVGQVNIADIIGWKNDVLVLNSFDFAEIKSRLEIWYGVDITLQGKPGKLHYVGNFENESLENVLVTLAYSAGFQYKINKKNVIIKF